jgi:hypothetical protein
MILATTAAIVTLAYGLPLSLCPIRWARTVGWWLPEDLRLARYFGRSLGTLILTLAALVMFAALHPSLEPLGAGVTALGMGLVSLPHFVGLAERAQPRFETIEGFGFLALATLFAWLALAR